MAITTPPDSSINTVNVQTGATVLKLLTFLEQNGLGLYAAPSTGEITVGGLLVINRHGTGMPALDETVPLGHSYGTISNLKSH